MYRGAGFDTTGSTLSLLLIQVPNEYVLYIFYVSNQYLIMLFEYKSQLKLAYCISTIEKIDLKNCDSDPLIYTTLHVFTAYYNIE